MISFGAPWAFALLPLALLVPFQARLTGRNTLAVARLADWKSGFSLRLALAWLPAALRTLGVACLVVALARPQITRTDVEVESNGLDILLVIDTSGSMGNEDMAVKMGHNASRLAVARAVAKEFVDHRPYDRIGVVAFGEEAFTQVPLTLDHETVQDMLGMLDIGVAGAQGTAVGTAIAVSAKRMKELTAPSKVVILLTDGRSNAGTISPMQAAEAAAALKIKVYTIGVGADGHGLFSGLFGGEGPDDKTLTAIAEKTGARYFRATDASALAKVYETIDELEPSPAKVKQIVDRQELYRWWLIPGALAWFLEVLLSATWLRRGP